MIISELEKTVALELIVELEQKLPSPELTVSAVFRDEFQVGVGKYETFYTWIIHHDEKDPTVEDLANDLSVTVITQKVFDPYNGASGSFAETLREVHWYEAGEDGNGSHLQLASFFNIENSLYGCVPPNKPLKLTSNPEYVAVLERLWRTLEMVKPSSSASVQANYV